MRHVAPVIGGAIGFVLGVILTIAILASTSFGESSEGVAVLLVALFLGGPAGAGAAVVVIGAMRKRPTAPPPSVARERSGEDLRTLGSDEPPADRTA